MKRFILALILITIVCPQDVRATVGIDLKLGGTYTLDGKSPGGVIQLDIGPLSPFAEYYTKSDTTTISAGLCLIFFKLPLPILQPYIGGGGGFSRSSGGGQTKSRALLTGIGGTDLRLTESLHIFGQAKYLYTFGSGAFVIRDLAIQGGVF